MSFLNMDQAARYVVDLLQHDPMGAMHYLRQALEELPEDQRLAFMRLVDAEVVKQMQARNIEIPEGGPHEPSQP